MKFTKQLRLLSPLLLLCLFACSSSDDTTTETYTVSGAVTINDPEFWIDGQTIQVGLFIDETTPEYSTTLQEPTAAESINFSFSNVEEGTYTCKVYVAENGVYKTDLYSYSAKNINATTNLGTVSTNLLSYTRVQNQLISKCTQCHGGAAGEPAADLILLEDESYANLVNVESTNSDLLRVKTDDATNSFIINVLQLDDLSFEHPSSSLATTTDIELVKLWINNGALNN